MADDSKPAKASAAAAQPFSDPKPARVDATKGAQVVLPPESVAAQAARGGHGTSIEENTVARDADLIAQGYDPAAPSGHQTR